MNPDPEPSSLDLLETSSSVSKVKKKKKKKKTKCRKHRKDDPSDPSSSYDSDYSDESHYRRKRHKNKKHRKKDPIKQCATLREKILTTAYKSNIITFKMGEYPLQRRIYFLTFVESLEMIFSQYTETCEVLLDNPKNRTGWYYSRLCKKGYQEPFACKHWFTQQKIDFLNYQKME